MISKPTFDPSAWEKLAAAISAAHVPVNRSYPGEPSTRQPVHTVYGGAHLFSAETITKLGERALASLSAYAPDFVRFAHALQLPYAKDLPRDPAAIDRLVKTTADHPPLPETGGLWLSYEIYRRLIYKLAHEPVEDFRIDFEDGFGPRSDEEEDRVAIQAACAWAEGLKAGKLAPFMGIRIKPLSGATIGRGLRTLDLFLTTLTSQAGAEAAQACLVTLPKILTPFAVEGLCQALSQLEAKLGLMPLKIELMIETTQSVLAPGGTVALRDLVSCAKGRCFAAHFGTYDYTASNGIISAEQTMDNPVCDFARLQMKTALSQTGVFLSDGATNVMPVGPHKPSEGRELAPYEQIENAEHVYAAWRLSASHIRGSLRQGIYQGWDLHPAQLPVRYGTLYGFFLSHLEDASQRLRRFLDMAAQATLSGNVFDDAATGQGLLNFFIRAWECGALSKEEFEATGLELKDLATRSFPVILAKRAKP